MTHSLQPLLPPSISQNYTQSYKHRWRLQCSATLRKWVFQTQFELFDGPITNVRHLRESFDHVTVRGGGHQFYSAGNTVPETSSIKGTLSSYPRFFTCGQKENQCPKWTFSIISRCIVIKVLKLWPSSF